VLEVGLALLNVEGAANSAVDEVLSEGMNECLPVAAALALPPLTEGVTPSSVGEATEAVLLRLLYSSRVNFFTALVLAIIGLIGETFAGGGVTKASSTTVGFLGSTGKGLVTAIDLYSGVVGSRKKPLFCSSHFAIARFASWFS